MSVFFITQKTHMQYPKHIGIIPDGNRTRAKENNIPQIEWHLKGVETGNMIIKHLFSQTPLEAVTLRGLSTENVQNRDETELAYLFELYQIDTELKAFLLQNEINFRRAGSENGLPTSLIEYLKEQEKVISFPYSNKHLTLAINYGGKDEIIRWIKDRIYNDGNPETLTEENLSQYLDFGDITPIDLVIRTKGSYAKRTSWFLSRWIGYAELYFCDKNFPDINTDDIQQALQWFDSISQQRNFGK